MKRLIFPVAILLAISGSAWAEDDGYLSMSVGLEHSSGKYGGTSTTDTTSIPVSVLYAADDWSLKLSVPYLFVTGDGSVVVSGSRGGRRGSVVTTTTTTTTRTTSSGVGDVVAFTSYSLLRSEEGDAGLDVAARIKFGTASTKFGSGENDYAVQTSGYVSFGDFTPSLMLGYEKLGSTATAPLDNAAYGSVGLDYLLSDESNMGMDYWYAQQASATGYAQRELSLYAATQIGKETYLRGFVMKGLSDGSPDTGYGVSLSTDF
ncbi:MAG: hypothetical protein KJ850_11595 [Gammaproteobacteria bacterium]|nr:hypothetical protein [Gammaproteobacteria bacterium]